MNAKTPLKRGRPTKYKPEYCEKLIKFFDRPLYITVTVQKMSASGAVMDLEERIANDIPTLEGFAVRELGVPPARLSVWANEFEDFHKAMQTAKGIQKEFLFTHNMSGKYNASFSKFFAINCLGMKETTHVESKNEHEVKGYGLAFDLSKKPE